MTLTKQRAFEGTAKKVSIIPEGNMCSIFILKLAFKTSAEGTITASGDVVTVQTKMIIAVSHYSLHMSNLEELPPNMLGG